uniref:receptor protein-tyrosine kinase n=1 Tax=Plectus sambesii TaxID=2011161 RepID=A0A914V9J9_9BILA
MRRLFAIDAAMVVLTAMVTITAAQVDLPLGGYYCFVRCVAKCMDSTTGTLPACSSQCSKYNSNTLCTSSDSNCWLKCKDLVEGLDPSSRPPQPTNLKAVYQEGNLRQVSITWAPIPLVSLYVLEYDDQLNNWTNPKHKELTAPMLSNFTKPDGAFCNQYAFRVAAVTAQGVSQFSKQFVLGVPMPQMEPSLNVTFLYSDEPYSYLGSYKSNGTIISEVEYSNLTDWPLGANDITVEVVVALRGCDIADLSSATPTPLLKRIPGTNRLTTTMPSDMLTKRCQLLFFPTVVKSDECDSRYAPPMNMLFKKLTCETVENSNCMVEVKRLDPLCGQITDFKANLLNPDKVDVNDPAAILSAAVSFKPLSRLSINRKPLYYILLYGDATPFETPDQSALRGANMSNVIGNVTTCDGLQFNETCDGNVTTAVITGIKFDQLYAVMVCAVLDKNFLYIPPIDPTDDRMNRIRTEEMIFKSEDYRPSNTPLILSITIPLLVAIIVVIVGIILCCWKKQRQQKAMMDLKMIQMKDEFEARYTDLPKKNDIWELERRNLIIHQDKKLGSGAFGAVYLGRIIGKAAGHKDANSTLGVNLMRAENCDVAVKMLPEYADDMSKSEFLKEITLMKSLGYHERMVNMLACVTDSEPLCLVVEYCSSGDLLHFLRDRCKYMMKLDDLGIDYKNPSEDDQFDPDMVVTLKQLLMFTVQISYGLEYLSQKGFIHRDVAARNVLVHDLTEAKIGDFGLCRYVYADSANYKSKGGRLPVKWMSPEAIRHYEFSTKSDVWSFGILMFEIVTLGGSPYPGIQPDDVQDHLERGMRMDQPDNCPDDFYRVMKRCWEWEPTDRPEFSDIRQKLAGQLEEVTEAYSYLTLNAERDYYNVNEYAENADANKVNQQSSDGQQVKTARSYAFHPPRAAAPKPSQPHSPLREVDSGLDNDSVHSCTPPASRKRTAESTNSDQLLMTPIEERRFNHNNFFDNKLPVVEEVRGGIFNSGFQYSIDDDGAAIKM